MEAPLLLASLNNSNSRRSQNACHLPGTVLSTVCGLSDLTQQLYEVITIVISSS